VDRSSLDQPISVALIEDWGVIAQGVRSWLAADGRAEVVAVGSDIDEVLERAGGDPDVLVLDLELGGDMVTGRVAELSDAGHRVVVFSMHHEPMIVRAVLDAGACAFLDKETTGQDQFVDKVVTVARDGACMTPAMAGGILVKGVGLSPRETEVLRYLFQGMTHDAIARRLRKDDGEQISKLTVKQYVDRARAKFAASGRPCRSNFALVARCIEEGLIRPDGIKDY
jgi:two-component system nitrate/nitrite response regulator NarL